MQLTININNKAVYKALVEFLKSLNVEIVQVGDYTDNEANELQQLSTTNLARAYADDEPEYNLSMLSEPNPSYEKR
jgi:hypothetical protein